MRGVARSQPPSRGRRAARVGLGNVFKESPRLAGLAPRAWPQAIGNVEAPVGSHAEDRRERGVVTRQQLHRQELPKWLLEFSATHGLAKYVNALAFVDDPAVLVDATSLTAGSRHAIGVDSDLTLSGLRWRGTPAQPFQALAPDATSADVDALALIAWHSHGQHVAEVLDAALLHKAPSIATFALLRTALEMACRASHYLSLTIADGSTRRETVVAFAFGSEPLESINGSVKMAGERAFEPDVARLLSAANIYSSLSDRVHPRETSFGRYVAAAHSAEGQLLTVAGEGEAEDCRRLAAKAALYVAGVMQLNRELFERLVSPAEEEEPVAGSGRLAFRWEASLRLADDADREALVGLVPKAVARARALRRPPSSVGSPVLSPMAIDQVTDLLLSWQQRQGPWSVHLDGLENEFRKASGWLVARVLSLRDLAKDVERELTAGRVAAAGAIARVLVEHVRGLDDLRLGVEDDEWQSTTAIERLAKRAEDVRASAFKEDDPNTFCWRCSAKVHYLRQRGQEAEDVDIDGCEHRIDAGVDTDLYFYKVEQLTPLDPLLFLYGVWHPQERPAHYASPSAPLDRALKDLSHPNALARQLYWTRRPDSEQGILWLRRYSGLDHLPSAEGLDIFAQGLAHPFLASTTSLVMAGALANSTIIDLRAMGALDVSLADS